MTGAKGETPNEADARMAKYENPMKPVGARQVVRKADKRIAASIKWQSPTFSYKGNPASFNPKGQVAREPHVPHGAEMAGDFP